MSDVLRSFIEQNFIERTVFQQLLQLQATFDVITEFHVLSQPNVCGLGGPRHQTLLRNVIEEIREHCAESLYSLCEWGSERANDFLVDLYPILKCPLRRPFRRRTDVFLAKVNRLHSQMARNSRLRSDPRGRYSVEGDHHHVRQLRDRKTNATTNVGLSE
ncbi:hypothetical protein KIN20_033214 [Parelaphostrongylus tenuis]|uniref:Uncharacterized protein n=1 Tax=Parelaphostrongylus tenuis TaxID=148309 RepID=A0AAD5R8A3_PARTN|nr:hypothetical protein KIN20_033214 [Parelaphostrongylus tenuis]